ncbi:AGAP008562-PA-like protein [Anopheles sinensis]|uniref:AGAP008562-PA-like protein n=1 Tax=Anopheles sinensis TaxID=74873 RepID=A0A084VUW6_ANOSI|nr:AGAP008562-PA-like protein [Anopheles sinensis]
MFLFIDVLRILVVLVSLPYLAVGQRKKLACSYAHPQAVEIGYLPGNITLDLCTHVIFKGFSYPQFVGRQMRFDDEEKKAFTRLLTNVRERSSTVRVVASIGGSATEYALTSVSVAHRRSFVQAAGSLLLELDADALELHWEHGESYDTGASVVTDRLAMVTFLRDLRQTVNSANDQSEGRNRELWISGTANPHLISTSYNVFEVCGLVDQVTLETVYIPRGASHAPIYSKPVSLPKIAGLNVENISIGDGIIDATNKWITDGCPPKKLILGVGLIAIGKSYMSFLGQFFNLFGQDFYDWGPVERHVVDYRELCTAFRQPGWSFVWEPHGLMPYVTRQLPKGLEQRYSYENVQSLGYKIELIEQQRLGGVYVDFLHSDDVDGRCGETYALTKFLASRLQAIPSDIGFAIDWI